MIRRTTINLLQRVISYLESTLVEKPKPKQFKLTHEDMDTIRAFLASPKLTTTDH